MSVTDGHADLLDANGRPDYDALGMNAATLDPADRTIYGRALGAERYFGDEATRARRMWVWSSYAQFVLAAAVTITATLSSIYTLYAQRWAIVTAALGAAIVLIRAIDSLHQSHETWLRTRATQQKLLAERIAFQSKTGPYADVSKAREEFRTRVEAILAGESQDWLSSSKVGQPPPAPLAPDRAALQDKDTLMKKANDG